VKRAALNLKRAIRPAGVTLAAGALPVLGVLVLAVWGPALATWFNETNVGLAVGLLFVVGVAACALALLPTHAVSLASGYLLGAWAGPLLAWAVVVAGSMLGYRVGRMLAGRGLAEQITELRQAWHTDGETRAASVRQATTWVTLLRLSPLAPFAATNAGLAALGVPFRGYVLGTALGMLPRVAVVAWLGAGMHRLDWSSPHSPWLLGLGLLATVLLLAFIARFARAALPRLRPAAARASAPPP
jgi:uncharacterized membrane protein YdjX (TVP38/TMEM64 family)